MRLVKTVKVAGREFELKELTVGEVVQGLDNLQSGLADLMFDDRLPLALVCKSAGVKVKELNGWYPADLETLVGEVEGVNPHCARLCRKLAEIAAAGREDGPGVPAPPGG